MRLGNSRILLRTKALQSAALTATLCALLNKLSKDRDKSSIIKPDAVSARGMQQENITVLREKTPAGYVQRDRLTSQVCSPDAILLADTIGNVRCTIIMISDGQHICPWTGSSFAPRRLGTSRVVGWCRDGIGKDRSKVKLFSG